MFGQNAPAAGEGERNRPVAKRLEPICWFFACRFRMLGGVLPQKFQISEKAVLVFKI